MTSLTALKRSAPAGSRALGGAGRGRGRGPPATTRGPMVSVPLAGRPLQVPPRKSAANGTAARRQVEQSGPRQVATTETATAPRSMPPAPRGVPISGLHSRIAGVSYAAAADPPRYLGRLGREPAIGPGQVADIVAATVRALQSAQPRPVVLHRSPHGATRLWGKAGTRAMQPKVWEHWGHRPCSSSGWPQPRWGPAFRRRMVGGPHPRHLVRRVWSRPGHQGHWRGQVSRGSRQVWHRWPR